MDGAEFGYGKERLWKVRRQSREGAESRIAVAEPNEMRRVAEADMLTEETVALQYIRKFIEYCRAEDIEPMLINIPYPASEDAQKAANAAMALAEEEEFRRLISSIWIWWILIRIAMTRIHI